MFLEETVCGREHFLWRRLVGTHLVEGMFLEETFCGGGRFMTRHLAGGHFVVGDVS